MGLAYYRWVFRRTFWLTLVFFVLTGLGWSLVAGRHAYLHFLANALPVWAMLFVIYAARYEVKQTYYRDVLGRVGDRVDPPT